MLITGAGLITTNFKVHLSYDSSQLLDWLMDIFNAFCVHGKGVVRSGESGKVVSA